MDNVQSDRKSASWQAKGRSIDGRDKVLSVRKSMTKWTMTKYTYGELWRRYVEFLAGLVSDSTPCFVFASEPESFSRARGSSLLSQSLGKCLIPSLFGWLCGSVLRRVLYELLWCFDKSECWHISKVPHRQGLTAPYRSKIRYQGSTPIERGHYGWWDTWLMRQASRTQTERNTEYADTGVRIWNDVFQVYAWWDWMSSFKNGPLMRRHYVI